MKLDDAKEIIKEFVDEPIVNFQIEKTIFDQDNGRELYNQTIREKVGRKHGVYIWIDKETGEIVYIGMAGKIKTDGTLGDHSIQNRLLASRGKDKVTKKDLQTNDYIKGLMAEHRIRTLDFYIIYSKQDEPPAYIEALLLYKYYKENRRLPKFNSSF
ncbi:hypothetical protein L0U88_15185 [Flavihumibacter sp. RY-1]|uniref:GIY-YIG domain-containing protein n=1 Tax=Flavihumibacter fluminis TaxID=2909236 RepID=A0ABS9BLH3_9BACT|nr:hypothetical protein [Flavihumibacter fluminis]MCF1715983.1 hypothetical protein [Flavihumibacter fluminis]